MSTKKLGVEQSQKEDNDQAMCVLREDVSFPSLEKTAVALLYRKHRNLAVLTHFILLNPSTGNISFLRKKN